MRDEIISRVKERGRLVSLSAWLSTTVVTIGIVAMVLLGVESKNSLDLVFFVMMLITQGIITFTWLPEGKSYGERNTLFNDTRTAYNGKVNQVFQKEISMELKEFCDYDFEVRKKNYIVRTLGKASLTLEDLERCRELPESDFYDRVLFWKKFKKWEDKQFGEEEITYNRMQVKVLYMLIFKPLPVQPNNMETIIGGATVNDVKRISDTTSKFLNKYLGGKFGLVIAMSILTAYLGLRLAQGISLQAILQAIMLIIAAVTSLTSSFLTGERAITVNKRGYYVDASNFIDRFFEWHNKNERRAIEEPQITPTPIIEKKENADHVEFNDTAESLGK